MKRTPPLSFPVRIPFVEQLGFELHSLGDGRAELRVDIRESHLNSWEVAHGGVLMSLLDVAMAHAARSIHLHQEGMGPGVVTIEMKTSFMQPAPAAGGTLVGQGRLLHRTRGMAFVEGTVFGPGGQLCAQSSGTFKYVPPAQPAGPLPTD